jgi:hypothetical protein
VDSISQSQQFTNPVRVPDGFPGRVLPVPHPDEGGQLYVKLRDDPSVVNLVTLTAQIAGGAKKSAKQQAAVKAEDKVRPDYVSPADSSSPASASQPASSSAPPGNSTQVAPTAPASSASTPPADQKPAPSAPPSTL